MFTFRSRVSCIWIYFNPGEVIFNWLLLWSLLFYSLAGLVSIWIILYVILLKFINQKSLIYFRPQYRYFYLFKKYKRICFDSPLCYGHVITCLWKLFILGVEFYCNGHRIFNPTLLFLFLNRCLKNFNYNMFCPLKILAAEKIKKLSFF